MLILKCPNLEELVLRGTSTVPADIHFVVEGRWPKLRKMSLGDVSLDLFPLLSGEKRPFITFLEEHPHLDSLSLSRHIIQPHHLSTLDLTALERLATFAGTLHQLQVIPRLHPQLKSVTFCDAVELRDISLPNIASLLRGLVSLTELKIGFTLHSMYDSGNLLGSLIQSCPKLRHLDLTCGQKPSFQLVGSPLSQFKMLKLNHMLGHIRENDPGLRKTPVAQPDHRPIPGGRDAYVWCGADRAVQSAAAGLAADVRAAGGNLRAAGVLPAVPGDAPRARLSVRVHGDVRAWVR